MALISTVPVELWEPENMWLYVEWIIQNLPGKEFRQERDMALKYWFQVNQMPYDGNVFGVILAG